MTHPTMKKGRSDEDKHHHNTQTNHQVTKTHTTTRHKQTIKLVESMEDENWKEAKESKDTIRVCFVVVPRFVGMVHCTSKPRVA